MSNLEIIERLCALVREQADVIEAQAKALAEAGAVCDALDRMSNASRATWDRLLGDMEG